MSMTMENSLFHERVVLRGFQVDQERSLYSETGDRLKKTERYPIGAVPQHHQRHRPNQNGKGGAMLHPLGSLWSVSKRKFVAPYVLQLKPEVLWQGKHLMCFG